jgi:hypothetical protein
MERIEAERIAEIVLKKAAKAIHDIMDGLPAERSSLYVDIVETLMKEMK